MIGAFNSPVESGARMLVLLAALAPAAVDINRLVLLDHALVHSADFNGPSSLHPELPIRSGELGVKRGDLEKGLQVVLRAGLAELVPQPFGIGFRANASASAFLDLLEAPYIEMLRDRAAWVVEALAPANDEELRGLMARAVGHWTAEFTERRGAPAVEGVG